MGEVEIHNGQIIVDGQPQEQAPVASEVPLLPPSVPGSPEDLDPNVIAALMAQTISTWEGETGMKIPMDLVNRLLTLKSARGHKLVWTRFDVHQTFALWARKMEGRAKL